MPDRSNQAPETNRIQRAYVYIVECSDGTLYTGWTRNVRARVRAHNAGRGARYTRGRRPVCLRYWERHPSRAAAMRRERAIKGWSRAKKLALIEKCPHPDAGQNGSGRAAPEEST
ncbi:MAG: GIY-YIG nuclease family protein [Anaerolineae bacterium]